MMKVKKYVGETMQDTIFKVKADLGSDAIILNTRKFKKGGLFGLFGRKKVEVLAALEKTRKQKRGPAGKTKNEEKTLKEIENLKQMVSSLRNNSTEEKLSGGSKIIYEYFREQGVEETYCQDFVEKTLDLDIESEEEAVSFLRGEIENIIGPCSPINIGSDRKVVMIAGPTGVGKTTTIAKLAAKFSLQEKKKVGLITADTYRIAAVQQLKTYSDIIDIPLEVVYNSEELDEVLQNKFRDYELLFVDTAGSSWNNQLQLGRLKSFRETEEIDEVHLMLGMNTSKTDINSIVEEFSIIRPDKIILSKIDETCSYGNILNIKTEIEHPFSYFTDGQDVPDDIQEASKEKLTNYLLGDFND